MRVVRLYLERVLKQMTSAYRKPARLLYVEVCEGVGPLPARNKVRYQNRVRTQLASIFVGCIEVSLGLVHRRRRGCVEAGAGRRAAVTARRESRRTGLARSPRDVAREASVSRPPRRGSRCASLRGAARGLSVHVGPSHFLSTFSSFSLLTR